MIGKVAKIAAYILCALVAAYAGLFAFVWLYDYFTFGWWINGWHF